VSFAHGSNDGQKGMGLIMLVLIGMLPATFALHLDAAREHLPAIVASSRAAQPVFEKGAAGQKVDNAEQADQLVSRFLTAGTFEPATMAALAFVNGRLAETLGRLDSVRDLSPSRRSRVRRDIYVLDSGSTKLVKTGAVTGAEAAAVQQLRGNLQPLIDYIPLWVKIAVALALGIGTMVGWRRIVTTLGEKIGKSHLTYAQGASAELVAAATIGMADVVGVPVSTTHILSSGIAGTMFANRSGLQAATLRNILLAWVLTVPACVLLGSVLFAASLYVVLSLAG
jgi:PiT family inorganic phosphate transporter